MSDASPIRVGQIKAVSPTLAIALRGCKLRAGLSRSADAAAHALGHPKAWLGTAYHSVLERTASLGANPTDEQILAIWEDAVQTAARKAEAHPLNRRFGSPESWPGFHLLAATALVRAKELSATGQVSRRSSGGGGGRRGKPRFPLWEHWISACDGKLVGKPDLIRETEVVDFKTGRIFEQDSPSTMKDEYLRQLRIYAYLVNEEFGWWPARGTLLPVIGGAASVDLEPAECRREALDALALLDEYNEIVRAEAGPLTMATPSPPNCTWCAFQMLCPAFWSSVSPDWAEGLGSGAVAGCLGEAPTLTHRGRAVSLTIDVRAGTVSCSELSLARMQLSVYREIDQLDADEAVRVVGLWARRDGSLRVTDRTLAARLEEVPQIVIRND